MKKDYRNINSVIAPPPYHMVGDGFRVHNFFPATDAIGLHGMSPFFLLDYNAEINLPPSEKPKGVGPHPHRGLETVTIAYKGAVAHHDSEGNAGVIYEGDVQWMTAGAGILHKEYHEKEFSKKGGPFHMVQIWTNLPAIHKMTPPKYQAIENRHFPRVKTDSGEGWIELIAGEFRGAKGPATTFSPMSMFNCTMKKEAETSFMFPGKENTGFLVVKGRITVNEVTEVPADHFVYFDHEGDHIAVKAAADSVILVLSGEPLNEPVSAYGPFLMNTKQEIQAAFDDYYNGKFGYLED